MTISPRTQDYFWNDIHGVDSLDAIQFDNGGRLERQMIRRAWATLLDAADAVEWAYCLWGRGHDDASCIVARLGGSLWTKKVEFSFFNGDEGPGVELMTATRGGLFTRPRIGINRKHSTWPIWHSIWEDGGNTDKYCVAIDIAAVIAHELVHLCDSSSDDPDGCDAGCLEGYVVGNIVHFALFHLHPGVLDSACCSFLWTHEMEEGEALFGAQCPFDIWDVSTHSPSDYYSPGQCWVDRSSTPSTPSSSAGARYDIVSKVYDSPVTDDKGLPERPEVMER